MLGTLRFFFFFAGRDVNGRKYLDRQPYSPRPSFPFLPLDPPDAGLVKPFGTHRFQQLEECKPSLHPRSFLHFTPRPPEPPCPPEIKDIYFMKEKQMILCSLLGNRGLAFGCVDFRLSGQQYFKASYMKVRQPYSKILLTYAQHGQSTHSITPSPLPSLLHSLFHSFPHLLTT